MKIRLTFVLFVLALVAISLLVGLSMEAFATNPRAESFAIRIMTMAAGAFVALAMYRAFMPQK